MTTPASLTFDGYLLDPANALLLRDGEPVALTPKAFAMLVLLCQRPGQLLSKDELFDAIWQTRHVTDGVLKNTVQELRQALGDDARSPRYIGTVHRRGYRFLAEVTATPADGDSIVGRDALLAQLDALLDNTLRGATPTTVFIHGEPGIGKTALIQAFAQRSKTRVPWVKGQCVAQYGQGEPYLPLLEAIGELARHDSEACIAALHRYAPTWLMQLPWLGDQSEREHLARETQGATKERMLRELAEFLRAWTQMRPLLLVIEDLHWSDQATLEAIAYLSRRRDGARLMILGSYRPVDVLVNEHPFKQVRNELMLQGLCRDLALELLPQADVALYLRQRFAQELLTDNLIEAVYRRTEGLPLFLARMSEEMAATLERTGNVETSLASLPAGLKHLVETQLDRLSAAGQRWIEVAAVSGNEFTPALLAGVTETTTVEAGAWCEDQARTHHILRRSEQTTPANVRYAFIHAYYRELAYARLPASRKVSLHRQIGIWLESHWGEKPHEIAAELALHFEKGRHYVQAVKYLHLAALKALSRHAPHEATELLQRGIRLADEFLADIPEHKKLVLGLLSLLPPALIAARGYTAPELAGVFQRKLELAEQLGERQTQFFTLYGMSMFHLGMSELDVAISLADHLLTMAEESKEPIQGMMAHNALGTTLLFAGKPRQANEHLSAAIMLAGGVGTAGDQLSQMTGQDPLASQLGLCAIASNAIGHPERALALMQQAHERANAVCHPFTQAFTLYCRLWLHRDRADLEQIGAYLSQLEELVIRHGFPALFVTIRIFAGWLAAKKDRDPSAIAVMHHALDDLERSGMRLSKTLFYHQIAEACLNLGQHEAALDAIDLALYELAVTGERRYEAETWRLRGNVLLEMGKRDEDTPEACFEKALAVAHAQGARLFELRAAHALANLTATPKAVQRLREVYDQFTEGFDMPDLQAARDLLTEAEALG